METETLEYIENYFQQTMADKDRSIFEERINADKNFAEDVAFYIGARQALKQQLLEQKQKQWTVKELVEKETLPTIAPVKRIGANKWWSYVAAACVLIFTAFYFFEKKTNTPQQLANNYITINLSHTSLTMDGSKDSMQLGKAAYNDKNYDKALQYFAGVANAHAENTEAVKMTGIVYLMTNNYDKALQQFDELANVKGLFSNPGLFYKAVTLLERNKEGDVKTAKTLLEQVVNQNLAHNEEAKDWLKELQKY